MEAIRRGLDGVPELQERLQGIRRQAVRAEEHALQQALFESLRDNAAVDEHALRREYEATQSRYAVRQVEALSWEFATRDAAVAAAATAQGLEPTAAERHGPAPVTALPAKLLPEAASLSDAEQRVVGGSVQEGWRVIELARMLPAEPLPYAEVRTRVESEVRIRAAQEALRLLVDSLRAELGVEILE